MLFSKTEEGTIVKVTEKYMLAENKENPCNGYLKFNVSQVHGYVQEDGGGHSLADRLRFSVLRKGFRDALKSV